MPQLMTKDGIIDAAKSLGVTVPQLRAVIKVESNGGGFTKAGRVLILFEPHILWRVLPDSRKGEATSLGLAYQKWRTRPYPKDSYPSFNRACELYGECGHQSASFGLPQIMGSNFKAAGYKSAKEMYEAFSTLGENEHVMAMCRFIKANPKMHAALKAGDWSGFASRYNGPGYKKNQYDTRLASAESYYKSSPFRGLAADAPTPSAMPVAQTQADRERKGNAAAVGVGGAGATASATTVAVPEKPATGTSYVPWIIGGGILIAVAIAVAVIIKKTRSVEREPVIEA